MAPLILSNLNVALIRNWTNRIRIWDSVTPNYYLSFTEKCVSKHKRIVNNMTSNEPELKLFSARIGILTLKSASQMQMHRFTFLRVDCMLSYCCYCVIVGTSVRTGNYFITLFAFLPLSHRVSFPISMTASHSSSIRNFCLQTNSGEADIYFTKTHSHSYSWVFGIQTFSDLLCVLINTLPFPTFRMHLWNASFLPLSTILSDESNSSGRLLVKYSCYDRLIIEISNNGIWMLFIWSTILFNLITILVGALALLKMSKNTFIIFPVSFDGAYGREQTSYDLN